jgi:uncharacterized protein YggE
MAETTITVQGSFSQRYPAELATVSLAVHHESAERSAAFSAAVASADAVHNSINRQVDVAAPAIVRWSSDSVQVWSERPWTAEGTPAAPVFHARVTVRATFGDLSAIASWIEEVAAVDGVVVESLEWSLEPHTLAEATNDVRARAVHDAVAKATVYARALGLATVRAVALADPGMLGDQGRGSETVSAKFSRTAMAVDGSPGLSLTPEPVEIAATIDGRFIAV